MYRKALALAMFLLCTGSLFAEDVHRNDWKISYNMQIVNPTRRLLKVEARYTFPQKTGEVTFQLDDADNHYTKGYRKYIRTFALADSAGNAVTLTTDTAGLYRATGLRGVYTGTYHIVLEHHKDQSDLGIEDTPLLWASYAVFPGASVVVYPSDEAGSRIGSIEVAFETPQGADFITPYEKIGNGRYRVENLDLLKSEFWAVGNMVVKVYTDGTDSLICGIGTTDLKFKPEDIWPDIVKLMDYYTHTIGRLPEHRISMTVFATPNSTQTPGFNSFGAVGTRSLNCLIDEQIGTDKLGMQMGLIAYNLLSFWTPGYFKPASNGTLDWFTTALLNYYQLKTMLTMGFTDEADFLSNMSRAYNTYMDALSRRGLSMSALLQLPNSNERSMYGFMLTATFDMMLINNTNGERSLDDLLHSLYSSYGGKTDYYENELWGMLRDLGLPEIQTLIDDHFKQARPINFGKVLTPFGLGIEQMTGEGVDIGFRVKGGNDLSVEWVEPGGPAQKAGIIFADVVSEVHGFKVNKASDVPKMLSGLKPGDDIDVVVLRNGAKKSISLELAGLKFFLIKPMQSAPASARTLWAKYKSAH